MEMVSPNNKTKSYITQFVTHIQYYTNADLRDMYYKGYSILYIHLYDS